MSDLAHRLIEENIKKQDPFLDLGNCSLKILPEGLIELAWLVKLNLGGNYVSRIINESIFTKNNGLLNRLRNDSLQQLSKLNHLRSVDLSFNPVDDASFLKELLYL